VATVTPIDELARRLLELVPSAQAEGFVNATREARDDLAANFKDTLRSGLKKLDLVTREEFDVQRSVLLRTRAMVEALERRIAELETLAGNRPISH